MPPALLALIALHGKAMFRRSARSAGTVRGVLFLALSASMIALWLITGSLGAPHGGRTDPETVRAIFPWWLLGICVLNLLTSAGERAIAFSPAEVDFLFPGPFTRRQVLGYKLLKSAVGAVVTATLFALLFQRFIQSWAAGGVGILLSLLFLQLFSMAMVLIGETLGEYADTRRRRGAIAVAAVILVAIALIPVVRAARGRSIAELVTGYGSTGVGQLLLAPFAAFGDVVTAKHLIPDALPSLIVAGLVLATLVTILMWLDVQHLDAAARAGQKMHERIQRMRRGGAIAFRAPSGARGWLSIPPLPRVGGAGPIAWRQLTTAVRQSRAVVMLLLVMCVALGPGLYVAGAGEHGDPIALIISVVVSMNVLFANALRFDFRGDLDHLDVLKSLPVTPLAIVIAQLVAPTLVLTLCQVVLFVGAGSFLRLNPAFLVAAGLMAVPLNALVFAIENLLFLLFPVRTWAASPGDLQGVGRRMTTFLAKTMVLAIGCALAVGAGALAWILAGKSASALVLTTAAVLAIETAALVPLMVTAFRRLETSTDTAL